MEEELGSSVRNIPLNVAKMPTEDPILGTEKVTSKTKLASMRRAQLQRERSG